MTAADNSRANPDTAVLFDLDGTLLDTAPDFVRCVNRLRASLDMSALPAETLRRSVSNGARAMIEIGFGLGPEDADYAGRHAAFLDLYEAEVAFETCLFPAMDALLQGLEAQGVPWGIVTNKPARFTVPLLAALNLDQRCRVAICPDHVAQRKPDPEALFLACREIGASPQASIYVGDHRRDIEAGRNAGMITVAARYGYIEDLSEVQSWQADHVIDSAPELAALLESLMHK
ncbi:MAG: HAD-IA family hydrolase [Oleiphilaceae bacterium]|nr:HAD-IA family hydrolase [Oleiphilaceae bacterium]